MAVLVASTLVIVIWSVYCYSLRVSDKHGVKVVVFSSPSLSHRNRSNSAVPNPRKKKAHLPTVPISFPQYLGEEWGRVSLPCICWMVPCCAGHHSYVFIGGPPETLLCRSPLHSLAFTLFLSPSSTVSRKPCMERQH